MPPAPRSTGVFYSQREELYQFESTSQYPEHSLLREVDRHPTSLHIKSPERQMFAQLLGMGRAKREKDTKDGLPTDESTSLVANGSTRLVGEP